MALIPVQLSNALMPARLILAHAAIKTFNYVLVYFKVNAATTRTFFLGNLTFAFHTFIHLNFSNFVVV
jgi:hypothetical protein